MLKKRLGKRSEIQSCVSLLSGAGETQIPAEREREQRVTEMKLPVESSGSSPPLFSRTAESGARLACSDARDGFMVKTKAFVQLQSVVFGFLWSNFVEVIPPGETGGVQILSWKSNAEFYYLYTHSRYLPYKTEESDNCRKCEEKKV